MNEVLTANHAKYAKGSGILPCSRGWRGSRLEREAQGADAWIGGPSYTRPWGAGETVGGALAGCLPPRIWGTIAACGDGNVLGRVCGGWPRCSRKKAYEANAWNSKVGMVGSGDVDRGKRHLEHS